MNVSGLTTVDMLRSGVLDKSKDQRLGLNTVDLSLVYMLVSLTPQTLNYLKLLSPELIIDLDRISP